MPNWIPTFLVRLAAYLAKRFDWIARWLNALQINSAVEVSRNRPHPWSTVHPYSSWTSLTDVSWSARHLPAVEIADLPAESSVTELFRRPSGGQVNCSKSTCLFPAFAQYLTDSFIRTRMPDTSKGEPKELVLRNTSNHQIDMCPLYGRTATQTLVLRLLSNKRGERGRLKSQFQSGEEYAPFLYLETGSVDPQFDSLDVPLGIDRCPPALRRQLFAFGGDRANGTPQVAMLNTLFLREHNRLAGCIERDNPSWDDERVFEVTRNAIIVLFIKIVIEEYINHIAPSPIRFLADPKVAYGARWNRPNWITTEFSLLYRWHSLLPDRVRWNGQLVEVGQTLFGNHLLLQSGLLRSFIEFSSENAGRLGALNTATVLLDFETRGVRQGRTSQVSTYADYRDYVGLKRPASFEDVTSDEKLRKMLKELYGSPCRIEFYPGLFVEDTLRNSPLPPLIMKFVAVDAFSQALTNPLLSEHVFRPETFSEPGWQAINTTSSLSDLLRRNVSGGLQGERLTMTRTDWKYQW